MTILTAQGRGAIGVVRVWGRGAVEATDAAFRPMRGRRLAETPPGRLRLGRMGRGLGDEVVAVVIDENPPAVEIQCHGGPAALRLVFEALQDAGAVPAEPASWAEHHAASPIQAAALVDLARAPTLRTAEILLEQAQGALDRELSQVVQEIRGSGGTALRHLERLIERGRVGLRLTTGWRVVIAGRPNVGKSRLLNALAGYQRAIVDPTPGTTRDAVTVATAFDGWPVGLVDTAGLRSTHDTIERSGIERALRQTQSADLVLKVLDRSEPLRPDDRTLVTTPGQALIVASKADLPPAWEPSDQAFGSEPVLVVSAERALGLDRLIAATVAALVPTSPDPGAGVPFRPEQLERLQRARDALRAGHAEQAIVHIEP